VRWVWADCATPSPRDPGACAESEAPDPADTLAGMKILVTGGAGYIGSTTAKALEEAGHVPVILDSLLTGPLAFVRDRIFYEGDIADRDLLARIVEEHPDIDATIHMAARIVVPESVEKPYEYYRDNVAKSLELFDQLVRLGKPRVLFSSSASLYAMKDDFEVTEDDPLDPTSPYARTKRMIEQVLSDIAVATDLRAIILRYFNPIGSDPDLETGIYAKEPSHVLGQLVMAARGQKPSFTITGTEHPTRDGTGIRDYIHVWDLAQAHVRAVERFDQVLDEVGEPSVVINVGRGDGVTVRELVAAFERVIGHDVPITEAPPRPGDAVGAFANVDRSAELLDWRTELSIDDAIASALAWGEKRREVLGYE
jgi:UDP-glucose 4-epimerase